MARSRSAQDRQKRGGGAIGWLTAPFEVAPDPRQAVVLSALLWAFAVFLVTVLAVLAGYVHVLGEYMTLVLGTLSGVVIAGGLFLLFRVLAGRPAWLALLTLPPAIVAAGVLQMTADYAGQFAMNAVFDGMNMPDASWVARMKVGLVYICIYTANAALFWVAFANRRVEAQRRLLAEREADALRAELRALRLQLNPHFMFNALSALSTLLLTDRGQRAAAMVDRLSDFLRAAMDVEANSDITLGDELSVLNAYLAVESERFGDRLNVSMEWDPAIESAMVPNLLLQPLVENAMKHAVERSSAPVHVSVRASRDGDRLHIEVADDGLAPPGETLRGHGVGLAAVAQRLALRFGDRASLDAGRRERGFVAVVALPLSLPARVG